MKYVERCLLIVWAGLQFLWLLLNLPLMIFGALITLVRTLLGLALLAGLGSCAYDFYTEHQARVSTQQARPRVAVEARRDRPRAIDKVLAGREAPREARGRRTRVEQSEEDRRREVAAARRARARYEAEESRLIEQGRSQ